MFRMSVLAGAILAPLTATADPVLLMAEGRGCHWCEKWHEEIGRIYPKTAEGKTAPLQRYDLYNETPDIKLEMRVRFTPTFILVDEGKEVGRIEGYSGDHFFWGLLSKMFERAGVKLDEKS